jgi:DNA-binding NarL/FixJ family response regulator
VRIWVDDSNSIYRRGLVTCLEADGFEIAGESADLHPEPQLDDCVVLLFDVDVVGLARATMLAHGRDVRLVGLVRQAREDRLYDSLTAGLSGILVRTELTPAQLATCLRAVGAGNGSMPPELLGQMLSGLARGAPRGAAGGQLVRREVDVLQLLAEGKTTRDIADSLAYSERTVKNIVHDLLVKMNCRTRAHAVALGTRQGLI